MGEAKTGGSGERYEKRDVHVVRVAVLTFVLLAALGLGGYLVPYFLFKYMAGEADQPAESSPLYQENQLPPSPRLQVRAARDLKALRDAEEKQLTTYGWVDRDNGAVRIPVERAMDLVAQRGLPQRPDVKEEAMVVGAPSPKAAPGAKAAPAAPAKTPEKRP